MGTRGCRGLAVGVDAGGTWVRLVAVEGGRHVASGRWPAAAGALGETLRGEWRRRGWSPASVGSLAVAARGVWTEAERRALAAELCGLARRVTVMADVEAAYLAALGDAPGILILAGTGSIVLGRDGRGRWARAGGLGPLLGDEGSAFWLGRAWLRLSLAADPAGPGLGRAREIVTSADAVARVAALAPTLLRRARRGDRGALAALREGQAALAGLAEAVVRQLRLAPPIAVSWAGSLAGHPWYRTGLRRALVRLGIRATWQPPLTSPAEAIARRAAIGPVVRRPLAPRA